MSKAKLIELIKMDPFKRMSILYEMHPNDLKNLLINALQDQHNDTCNGCALKIHTDRPDEHHPILNLAQCSCLNYQDKDLEDL